MKHQLIALLLFCGSAIAEPLVPAQELGLTAAASSVKALTKSGYDFKSFESKPLRSAFKELVDAIRAAGAPDEKWGWACRVRAETIGAILERSGVKAADAGAATKLFRSYPFTTKPPIAERAEMKPLLEALKNKSSGDGPMSEMAKSLAAAKDAAEFVGKVRGYAFFVSPRFVREWSRIVESSGAIAAPPLSSRAAPGALTLKISPEEKEKFLRRIDRWEIVDEAAAIGLLAAPREPGDEKGTIGEQPAEQPSSDEESGSDE